MYDIKHVLWIGHFFGEMYVGLAISEMPMENMLIVVEVILAETTDTLTDHLLY